MKKTTSKSNHHILENVPAFVIALALAGVMFATVLVSISVYTAILAVVKAFPEIAAETFSLPMIVITSLASVTVYTIVKVRRIKKASRLEGFKEGRRVEREKQESQSIVVEPRRPECYREIVYLHKNPNDAFAALNNDEAVASLRHR